MCLIASLSNVFLSKGSIAFCKINCDKDRPGPLSHNELFWDDYINLILFFLQTQMVIKKAESTTKPAASLKWDATTIKI